MEEQKSNDDPSTPKMPESISQTSGKRHLRPLLILFLVFFAIVVIVFLTHHRDTINWVEDYDVGVNLAKQQNKPILLTFHKRNIKFCQVMEQYVYNNPEAIKYVETNFIPVLIDVDRDPEIAKQYNLSYYPTYYVKDPNSDKLSDPLVGCHPRPSLFIERIDHLLDKIKQSDE